MSEQNVEVTDFGIDAVFAEDERAIYAYKDRGVRQYSDPLRLWSRFVAAQADILSGEGVTYWGLLQEMRNLVGADPDPVFERRKLEILVLLGDLGRAVFLKEPLGLDGSGWTDMEAIAHLNAFLLWQADVEGKAGASPNGSTPTGGPGAGSVGGATPASASPPGTASI
jgi:hypothetical protein